MIVTVASPTDSLLDSPAFDGESADAYKYLLPGSYRCEYEDGPEGCTLVVTETESHLVTGSEDESWVDSYGNAYATTPAASTVTPFAAIMLMVGTTFRYEDTSEYGPEDAMPANGETSDATDMHEGGPVYGRVQSVKLVGDRAHLTIADYPAPAWTFSIPAATPVHVA